MCELSQRNGVEATGISLAYLQALDLAMHRALFETIERMECSRKWSVGMSECVLCGGKICIPFTFYPFMGFYGGNETLFRLCLFYHWDCS